MYFLLAAFSVIVGICLFVFSKRMTKNNAVAICVKIVGIILVIVGVFMLYLVFSGKVVLPLSKE